LLSRSRRQVRHARHSLHRGGAAVVAPSHSRAISSTSCVGPAKARCARAQKRLSSAFVLLGSHAANWPSAARSSKTALCWAASRQTGSVAGLFLRRPGAGAAQPAVLPRDQCRRCGWRRSLCRATDRRAVGVDIRLTRGRRVSRPSPRQRRAAGRRPPRDVKGDARAERGRPFAATPIPPAIAMTAMPPAAPMPASSQWNALPEASITRTTGVTRVSVGRPGREPGARSSTATAPSPH
jgi:hypothetical protein